MIRVSTGSQVWPSISFMITCGLPTWSSKPSRRMVSIRMPRCSRPRPETRMASEVSSRAMRRATLRSSSFSRRSQSWRPVTYLPSRPAKGESFTRKDMVMVGSSTLIGGSGLPFSGSAMVAPISTPSTPMMAQMSPAEAESTSTRFKPSKDSSFWMRCLVILPLRSKKAMLWPLRRVPADTRPTPMRPT